MITRKLARSFSRSVQSIVKSLRTAFTRSWAISRRFSSPNTLTVLSFTSSASWTRSRPRSAPAVGPRAFRERGHSAPLLCPDRTLDRRHPHERNGRLHGLDGPAHGRESLNQAQEMVTRKPDAVSHDVGAGARSSSGAFSCDYADRVEFGAWRPADTARSGQGSNSIGFRRLHVANLFRIARHEPTGIRPKA